MPILPLHGTPILPLHTPMSGFHPFGKTYGALDTVIMFGISAYYVYAGYGPGPIGSPFLAGVIAAAIDELIYDFQQGDGIGSHLSSSTFWTFILGSGIGALAGSWILTFINPSLGMAALGAGVGSLIGGSLGYMG